MESPKAMQARAAEPETLLQVKRVVSKAKPLWHERHSAGRDAEQVPHLLVEVQAVVHADAEVVAAVVAVIVTRSAFLPYPGAQREQNPMVSAEDDFAERK